ncbi:MAG: GNAT family acetyltransferase [Fretibacterium sp.]|nr:GNAT family acetyltransferase [Fretibacterium sp.]
MLSSNKYRVVNIWDSLGDKESDQYELMETIADFTCPRNPDVERFLKNSAVDFTRKSQSVTYLAFSNEGSELLGYFSIAVKPLTISADKISRTFTKRLERVSKLDEESQTYTTAAYLIAQLGKNYTDGANEKISGSDLLKLAWDVVKTLQRLAGGVVAFVEAEEHEKLLDFYQRNHFWVSDKRVSDSGDLVQLIRIIK